MHKAVILLTQAKDREEAVEKVNEFMEPYDEGLEVEPYIDKTRQEIIDEMDKVRAKLNDPDCNERLIERYGNGQLEQMTIVEFAEKYLGYSEFDADGNALSSFNEDSVWDWFVIGGRWSGTLVLDQLDPDKLKSFWHDFEEQKLGWVGAENTEEKQRERTHALFMSYFPEFTGEIPIYRSNQYNEVGASDDVMPLKDCLIAVSRWHGGEIERAHEDLQHWTKEGSKEMIDWCNERIEELRSNKFNFDTNVYNTVDMSRELPEDVEGWYAVMVDMHD